MLYQSVLVTTLAACLLLPATLAAAADGVRAAVAPARETVPLTPANLTQATAESVAIMPVQRRFRPYYGAYRSYYRPYGVYRPYYGGYRPYLAPPYYRGWGYYYRPYAYGYRPYGYGVYYNPRYFGYGPVVY